VKCAFLGFAAGAIPQKQNEIGTGVLFYVTKCKRMPRVSSDFDSAIMAIFGENVRGERSLRGWSIERLATLAEVAIDTVFRIEKGLPSTKRSRLRVCKALQSSYKRMTMKARVSGPGYAIHRQDDDWWVVHWAKRTTRSTEEEEERIQNAEERHRLGSLHFVNHFVQMLNCRLPRGKLVAGVLELFGEGSPSKYLAGEVFIYVLSGAARVVIGDDEFVLREGEAATIQCAIAEFFFEPSEPVVAVPPKLLYVRLDVGTEGHDPQDEELVDFVRQWDPEPRAGKSAGLKD
jgi:hypothetical protein